MNIHVHCTYMYAKKAWKRIFYSLKSVACRSFWPLGFNNLCHKLAGIHVALFMQFRFSVWRDQPSHLHILYIFGTSADICKWILHFRVIQCDAPKNSALKRHDHNSRLVIPLFYRKKSMDLVRQRHPSWSDSLIEEIARLEYETAAQQFMEGTLLLVQKLRPKSVWGFYGFPNCYNHKDSVPFNCSKLTIQRNDQLSWMFDSSSALFPSIYLHDVWHRNSSLFVKYRLQEGFRRAKQLNGHSIPVYPYVRITYAVSQIYLNEVS